MVFRQIVEPKLAQYSYLIGCQRTREAIIVDPMRDVQRYFAEAERENLELLGAAETHIHADYVSGLRECAERGLKIYASDEGAPEWRYEWLIGSKYNHRLLHHNDTFRVGHVHIRAVHTPGHTPEHLMFVITDAGAGALEPLGLLTGDFVFVGDVGRPDLLESAAGVANVMESSARQLYRSLLEFRRLPEYYHVWPGHGAGSACGKALGAVPSSTVGYELRFNESLRHAETEEQFVHFILDGQPEPPYYFGRMKRINREGPPLLATYPNPSRISIEELLSLAGNTGVALLDTRSREEFMSGYIPGSIFVPWNRQFNTIAGCYVQEDTPIYLLIEDSRVEEAVLDLFRIGLDTIAGYATPEMIEHYVHNGGRLERIPRFTINQVGEILLKGDQSVLDVRSGAEFRGGHLPNAVNIAHTRLLSCLDDVPTRSPLYIHCATGSRSAVAAPFLKRHGRNVIYVDGDFDRWWAECVGMPQQAGGS